MVSYKHAPITALTYIFRYRNNSVHIRRSSLTYEYVKKPTRFENYSCTRIIADGLFEFNYNSFIWQIFPHF